MIKIKRSPGVEREVIRQEMQIKWNRDLKESWCWIICVSVVALPARAVSACPGNLYAKAATSSWLIQLLL